MIDTTKKYWTGSCADDIDEYLRSYSECDNLDVKTVLCRSCQNDVFEIKVDQDEDAIQVKCLECGVKKILLDCEEVWEDAEPRVGKCPICKGKKYNVRIGFERRKNGSVKWVYVGNRCTQCETLGSYLDWEIDYEPTDEMENNI